MFPARVLFIVIAAAAACAASGRALEDPEPEGTGIVVRGSEMTGNLLDGLRTRIRSMTVRRETGACPRITFRGQRSSVQQGNPSVYVDGTLMADTCILTQIPAADVDFVEVYTSGINPRPEVQRNPFGAIFVYRLRR